MFQVLPALNFDVWALTNPSSGCQYKSWPQIKQRGTSRQKIVLSAISSLRAETPFISPNTQRIRFSSQVDTFNVMAALSIPWY